MASRTKRSRDQEREPSVVRHIVGRVGRDPEIIEHDDSEFVSFSVAVTRLYGSREEDYEDGETRWYSVKTRNPDLIEWVQQNVVKGSIVAVEGFPSEREYQGKTFHNFSAARIGLVEWFARKSRTDRTTDEPEGEEDW